MDTFINESEYARSLIEASLDPLVTINADGKIMDVNEAMAKITDKEREKLIGTDFKHYFTDPEKAREVYQEVFAKGFVANYPLTIIDGVLTEVLFNGSVFKNKQGEVIGAVVVARDVSEKKKLERAFEIERQQFYDLFSEAPFSLGVLSGPDHRFEIANPMYLQLIGKKDIIGKSVKDVLPEVEVQGFLEILDSVYQTGKTFNANEMLIQFDLYGTGELVDTYLNFIYQAHRDDQNEINGILFFAIDVTEQVVSRKTIEESEKEVRAIAESMPQIVWVTTADGKNIYFNNKWEDYTGLTLEESLGDGWLIPFHEEDKPLAWEAWRNAVKTLSEYAVECRLRKHDGSYCWWLIRGIPQIGNNGEILKWYGTCTDIEEIKRSEKSIIKEKALSDSVINSLPGIFYLFDKTGKLLRWNKEVERVSGYSGKEIANMKPLQFFNDKDETLISEKIVEAFTKGESNTETHFVTKDNKNIPFYFSGKLTTYNDESCLIGIGVDITERKRTEIKLIELNENLKKQAKELFLSNTELEQFAYVASHDLQEPLRMVTSFLTQLEKKYEDVIDDKGKQYIHFAVDGAKRMRQIILDLLEFSKVGKTEDELEYLKPDDLLNEVKFLLRKQIKEKKATINVDQLPEIRSHRSPLRQVFQNLISNALKYSNKEIPVRIHITAKEFNDNWQFAVIDNGIGIEKEYFEKIFILFQRLHINDEYSGTGMGLAITKKIIGTLGGKIWVESEIGKGSSFYFTLKK